MEEREHKLLAAADFTLPDLGELLDGIGTGTVEEVEQEAAYFDTPDLRLSRAGVSLRFRSDDGWTVKLPEARDGDAFVRSEHTFAGEAGLPPAAARELVRAWSRSGTLGLVARICTHRRKIHVRDRAGRPLGEIDDDRVTGTAVRQSTFEFHEIEVEAGDDVDAVMVEQLVERIRRAGAGVGPPMPKIARALGPAARLPPDIGVPETPDRHAPVDHLVRAALASSVGAARRPRSPDPAGPGPRGGAPGARSRHAGCAPTCGRSGRSSSRAGANPCARSCGGWAPCSAGCGTPTSCSASWRRRASSSVARSTATCGSSPAGSPRHASAIATSCSRRCGPSATRGCSTGSSTTARRAEDAGRQEGPPGREGGPGADPVPVEAVAQEGAAVAGRSHGCGPARGAEAGEAGPLRVRGSCADCRTTRRRKSPAGSPTCRTSSVITRTRSSRLGGSGTRRAIRVGRPRSSPACSPARSRADRRRLRRDWVRTWRRAQRAHTGSEHASAGCASAPAGQRSGGRGRRGPGGCEIRLLVRPPVG